MFKSSLVKNFFVGTISCLLSACAFGPLTLNETARTNGRSKSDIGLGWGNAGQVFKYSYGFTDNFDLGVQLEPFSSGLRAKYAFYQQEFGWSFATAIGVGESIGGNHSYMDLLSSYSTDSWEAYQGFRYVHAKTDVSDFNTEDFDFDFYVQDTKYEYAQAFLGVRFLARERAYINIEVSQLITLDKDKFDVDDVDLIFGLGLTFKP